MTHLPAILSALLAVADEEAVLCFMNAHAGQQLSVPRVASGCTLERCFGVYIAQTMVAYAGGETISIPQCRAWRIQKLAERGLSSNQIALTVGATSRRVSMVLRDYKLKKQFFHSARRDDRQMDIIDFIEVKSS